MKLKKRFVALFLAVMMLVGTVVTHGTDPVYAASFNPVVDTITSTSDSRIEEMLAAIDLQSFSSTTSSKVKNYISYFIYDSIYAAVGGEAWPYTNDAGYVSTVTDDVYTVSGINGSGCFAYSKFVMNVVYGTTGEVLKEGESAGSVTASGLETFLRTYAQAGEQIRLGNIHSVTFISCTTNGFYYMDVWGGYIRLHYTTFATFASACNSATSSIQLYLYNANTATNDVSKQTSSSDSSTGESTLAISPTSYPSGQILKGNSFSLKGTVSSNYTITSVTGTIYTEDGTVSQTKTVSPNSKSFTIGSSSIDSNLKFGSLAVGGYYLEYTATDSSGKTVVWTSDIFNVVSTVSTLSINPVNYPTGSMLAQSFTLTGTVTSNYTLTSVSAYIYNTNGDTLYSAMVTSINSTTFSIANSGIDNALPFGSLAVGSYYLVYEATDQSGASATWTSDVFNIVSSTSEVTQNTTASTGPTISMTSYPTGNFTAKSFTLKGTITSTGTITSVVGQIVEADGTVNQTVTASTSTSSFTIASSTIDNRLKFASLSSGYYYITISATDGNGTTTWQSDVFAVADSTLYVDVTNSGSWYYSYVYALSQVGLFYGTNTSSGTCFYPNKNLTRAQAVCLFYRLYCNTYGTPTVTGSNPFTDLTNSSWYLTALNWAYQNGIVSGTSATTFEPNRSITRQEMARMIYNYAQKYYGASALSTDYLSSYTDGSSVSSWAKESVNWCIGKGIFTSISTTSKTFSPKTSATRAQAAVMFYQIMNNL